MKQRTRKGVADLRVMPPGGELSAMYPFARSFVAAALACASSCNVPPRGPIIPPPYTGNVTIIGHRGASGHAPEHTWSSYDAARQMGAHYIEQDLQRTSDRVLVILHDETMDRTLRGSECKGPVRALAWRLMRRCDAGTWFNERFADKARRDYRDEHPIALTELFARYRDSVRYYIETKQPEEAPGMERQLLEAIHAAGFGQAEARAWRIVIQSFSSASLRIVRASDKQWPLVQLLERLPAERDVRTLMDTTAEYANGVGPNRLDVDSAFVAAAHARCLVVHPYTVNSEEEMKRLARAGVDGMFTDYPDVLRKVLASLGPTRAPWPTECPKLPLM